MEAPTATRSLFQKRLRCFLRALTVIACTALMLMMCLTVLDVVLRNFFNIAMLGTYDIVETMMVCVVFLGIGEAFLDDTHITVDIIDSVISPKAVRVLQGIALVVSAVFLGLLLRYMPIPAWEAYIYGDRKPDLPIPLILLWIPCLVGIAAAFVAVLCKLWGSLRSNTPPAQASTQGDTP